MRDGQYDPSFYLTPMNSIEANSLVREYAPNRGVSGVSLNVAPGECCAVLGRNGCGKTTLTRLLLGLERLSAGRLSVLGHQVNAGCRSHLRRCGAITDTSVHWEHLTACQNASFIGRSFGMSPDAIDKRLTELLRLADLADHANEPVSKYSFGMRRKLSIIQAILHEPELLILDEPTAGLDAQFLDRLGNLIRLRCTAGQTTWITTNDLDWSSRVATRVAFMDAGRIVAEGTPTELLSELSPMCEVKIVLESPADLGEPQLKGVQSLSRNAETFTAVVADDQVLVGRLIQWVCTSGGRLRTIEVRRPTLRDAFLVKTGKTIET